MPTGYTYPIHDGENISFTDFALLCSRAMSAAIMQRDEPLSVPIKGEYVVDSYYYENVGKAQAAVEAAENLGLIDAEIAAAERFEQAVARYEESKEKVVALEARYQAMLDQVKDWEPPTEEHVGLKDFMIEQLQGSIDFDCNTSYLSEPERMDGDKYKAQELKYAEDHLKYAKESLANAIELTRGRNKWVADLKESLGVPS